MNKFSMFLCFMVTIAAVGATIYNQICPDGIQQATCFDNKIYFEENCPPGVKIRNLTDTEKKVLVKAHNERRNYIASGNCTKLSPACRMVKINWKNSLAEAAASDIRKYKTGTDLCNNTAAFRNAKQSIASWIFPGTANETRDMTLAVELFYKEVENVNQTVIDSYPASYNGPKIDSFTRMMIDRTRAVGCAIGAFPILGSIKYYMLMVCNYAIPNLQGLPVYVKCDRAGEECKKRSTNYFNLCAAHEN